jgi:hypothetical protein
MLLTGGTQDARWHRLPRSGERVRPAQGQGQTPRDTERQNRVFIRDSGLTRGQEGTGRDTRLRSDCGQNLCSETHLPGGIERGPDGVYGEFGDVASLERRQMYERKRLSC